MQEVALLERQVSLVQRTQDTLDVMNVRQRINADAFAKHRASVEAILRDEANVLQ